MKTIGEGSKAVVHFRSQTDENRMAEPPTESRDRRLSDKVLLAFDMACEQNHLEAAEGLYRTLEIVLTRQGGANSVDKRMNVDFIGKAYTKLRRLREGQIAA